MTKVLKETIRGLAIVRGQKPIEALNKKVIKASETYRAMLHQALVSCVAHAVAYRDTTLLTALYDGIGNETNKGKGIATWLRAHSNLDYRKGKNDVPQWLKPQATPDVLLYNVDANGEPVLDNAGKRIPVAIEDWNGIDTPFYNMAKVEKDNEVPSIAKAFEHLFAKYGKMLDKGLLSVADAARFAYVKQAYADFNANEAGKYDHPVGAGAV